MPQGNRKCKFCAYKDKGECHRFPPTIFMDEGTIVSHWPDVGDTEYCYEYKEIDDYIQDKCEHEWVEYATDDFGSEVRCSICGKLGDEEDVKNEQ